MAQSRNLDLIKARIEARKEKMRKRKDKAKHTQANAPANAIGLAELIEADPWAREFYNTPHSKHFRPVFGCRQCIARAFPHRRFDIDREYVTKG